MLHFILVAVLAVLPAQVARPGGPDTGEGVDILPALTLELTARWGEYQQIAEGGLTFNFDTWTLYCEARDEFGVAYQDEEALDLLYTADRIDDSGTTFEVFLDNPAPTPVRNQQIVADWYRLLLRRHYDEPVEEFVARCDAELITLTMAGFLGTSDNFIIPEGSQFISEEVRSLHIDGEGNYQWNTAFITTLRRKNEPVWKWEARHREVMAAILEQPNYYPSDT